MTSNAQLTSSVTMLLLAATSAHNLLSFGQWIRAGAWSAQNMTADLQQVSASSKLECAAKCLRLSTCVGFCYVDNSTNCSLAMGSQSVTLIAPLNSGSQPGIHCYYTDKIFRNCPAYPGYQEISGQCVKLVQISTGISKADALDVCQSEGGHLYDYKILEEGRLITTTLVAQQGYTYGHFWVGGEFSPSHSNFFWSDGSLLLRKDNAWAAHEPNNIGSENCVGVYTSVGSNQYYINNFNCGWTGMRGFICQIDI